MKSDAISCWAQVAAEEIKRLQQALLDGRDAAVLQEALQAQVAALQRCGS